jgi:hypothetical protein
MKSLGFVFRPEFMWRFMKRHCAALRSTSKRRTVRPTRMPSMRTGSRSHCRRHTGPRSVQPAESTKLQWVVGKIAACGKPARSPGRLLSIELPRRRQGFPGGNAVPWPAARPLTYRVPTAVNGKLADGAAPK